jgi:tRNA (cmo5U34)-methyltransferase
MSQFDASAREWDNNPVHWERSEAIAKDIISLIPLRHDMKALEFGAGTGILSFLLEDRFSEVTLMDSSREMVNVMTEKVTKTGLTHLKPLWFDLEKEDFTGAAFDCIFTQMVMHHVDDTEGVVKKFFRLLNPGGWLAIADLYREDGTFHSEGFTGHKGFDPEEFRGILSGEGFRDGTVKTCFVVRKEINGNLKEFPVFLMTARK